MQQARSFFEDFARVCAGTALVVFTSAFITIPYALERQPGDPVPVTGAVPHLS